MRADELMRELSVDQGDHAGGGILGRAAESLVTPASTVDPRRKCAHIWTC